MIEYLAKSPIKIDSNDLNKTVLDKIEGIKKDLFELMKTYHKERNTKNKIGDANIRTNFGAIENSFKYYVEYFTKEKEKLEKQNKKEIELVELDKKIKLYTLLSYLAYIFENSIELKDEKRGGRRIRKNETHKKNNKKASKKTYKKYF